jgi:HEAT repeat protein
MVRSMLLGAPLRAAVVAGHTGDLETASRLVVDPDPAVRAAALGALSRMGALETDTLTGAMSDPAAAVRRRACALAGRALGIPETDAPDHTPGTAVLDHDDHAGHTDHADHTDGADSTVGQVLDALLRTLASDADPAVVESAAWGLGEAGSKCGPRVVEALELVTRSHLDPLCREAAVAALGAIGDRVALDSVLGALEDKPAIRRRATIALAAFDDPRVDVALRRCLQDRDWQVRQAAEDLLGRA